ncbi:MAG: S-methyl-5-thioribose-1-phosphate isomerase [Pseudomonadota bacterium]
MKINGEHYRSLWWNTQEDALQIIDQRWLPHDFRIETITSMENYATAITDMWVRGAPLIGATAAYAIAFAMRVDPSDQHMEKAWNYFHETRPTAINLRWALNRVRVALLPLPEAERYEAALKLAHEIADEDVEINAAIGRTGLELIKDLAAKKNDGEPVRILTQCNAGWLATVDWGTATSPMYHAHDENIPIHIWVDETRPRNQGALTAWELGSHGVPHTYIVDNAGGHLMQEGLVDMVIVGTDRTTNRGDVCNKIGTYLKALAAKDNDVPFYVALPSPTIDWTISDGVKEIPIEERNSRETTHILGKTEDGQIGNVQVVPDGTNGGNPAFDVTPNHMVTGLITERGVCTPTARDMAQMFPDLVPAKAS